MGRVDIAIQIDSSVMYRLILVTKWQVSSRHKHKASGLKTCLNGPPMTGYATSTAPLGPLFIII